MCWLQDIKKPSWNSARRFLPEGYLSVSEDAVQAAGWKMSSQSQSAVNSQCDNNDLPGTMCPLVPQQFDFLEDKQPLSVGI